MIYGATLVSQIADSAATAVVPLPETVKRKNMVMLLVAFPWFLGLEYLQAVFVSAAVGSYGSDGV